MPILKLHLHLKRLTIFILFISLVFRLQCQSNETKATDDNPETFLVRGDKCLQSKEYDKAIIEYTRAIELKPDFAEAYNNRAYAYYSKYDGTGDPLSDLNRAIEIRPNFPHAYNTRGCVYMAGGNPDKAITDFTHAIQLQPDYPRAYRNRANAYLRKGHISLAVKDFEQAGGNPTQILIFISIWLLLALTLVPIGVYRLFYHKRK
jgi:tetratricopeptide (TPR) repeat protein